MHIQAPTALDEVANGDTTPIIVDIIMLSITVFVGFLAGELISKIKLPKVLGYLFVGMLLGPYALNLIKAEIFSTNLFELSVLVTLGFVGYSIGSGIHVNELKAAGSKMTVIGLFEAYTPFVLVTLAMYLILGYDLITSLVVGAIALAVQTDGLLVQLEASKADLLLLDWRLPCASIEDLISDIRGLETPPKIVVLSIKPEDKALVLTCGADAFIPMNAPPDKLLEVIRSLGRATVNSNG